MILVCVLLKEGVSTKLLFALRSVSTIDHTIHAVLFLFSFKIQTVDFGGGWKYCLTAAFLSQFNTVH